VSTSRHVAVVGGGIAGASAAYALAKTEVFDRVVLLEAEDQLAQHTTGRSAAMLTENYGEGPVRPLTAASLDFLHNPPDALVDNSLLHPRGVMTVATSREGYESLDTMLAEGRAATHPIGEIDVDHAQRLAPHIRFTSDHRAMWEEHAYDIDVAALHQAFVRGLRAHGGEIATSHRVDAVRPAAEGWSLETTAGSVPADLVVNAAGAWGDVVAQRAGIEPVGLQPLRRTAFMVKSPYVDSAEYPFVVDSHHSWYLRPDGSQFMCSPADETPSEPCDARAEEIDIARTIDAINENTTLDIRSITSRWAGLRTFGPDRSMVIGPDPGQPTFVWCVGQGGTGIQTAPGAGQLIADLLRNERPGPTFDGTGLQLEQLLPDRLRT
jgi:D-arginine dehydrogenase